jgi:hypothetical protein
MSLSPETDELDSDSIVASCDCLTKTDEVKFHRKGCKYRLIQERNSARRIAEGLRDVYVGRKQQSFSWEDNQ